MARCRIQQAIPTSRTGSLFDLKFTQFVTPRVIPVLYTIWLVLISIVAVISFFVALISGFAAFGDEDTGPRHRRS